MPISWCKTGPLCVRLKAHRHGRRFRTGNGSAGDMSRVNIRRDVRCGREERQ